MGQCHACQIHERSTASAVLAVPVAVHAGPTVSLADMDVAEAKKEMDDAGFDFDSTAVRPHRPSLDRPRLPGVHRLSPPQPQHLNPSPPSSQSDPNVRPGLEESGRGVPGHLSRLRESVRQVERTKARH